VTGLIYLVIIALWAAVLIPAWLRRHDQISEVRSTARFSSAMRSLGDRGRMQYAADTYILDSRDVDLALQDSAAPRSEARMTRPTADRTERRTEGLNPEYERELVRQAAATRRAIVLGSLTALLLVTLLLAIASVVPKWAPALAAIPVVAFVIAAAMTSSARSAAPARSEGRRPASRADRRAPAASSSTTARRAAPQQTDEEWENWNAWDDDSWEAQPTTLPTYVNAPRASAVPRGIDRDTPGEWTGEAMVQAAQAMRSRPRSQPLPDASQLGHGDETAEIPAVTDDYPARRAVNE
jgi:hypothetical protein